MSDMTAERFAKAEQSERFKELSLLGKDALILTVIGLQEAAAQARAEEREACLEAVEEANEGEPGSLHWKIHKRAAAAIRARSTD